MEIVSFVILHYKDWKVTDSCVRSILKMDDPMEQIRIVIADNDIMESIEKRRKLQMHYRKDSRIDVLTIKENGGFSYANNKGYLYAKEMQNASYIILLNNDIEFLQKDFLKRLDASCEKHPCHVLGPDVLRQSTGEHQNPLDTRLRTKEEAEFTVRMNRLALKFYPLVYPFLCWKLKHDEKVELKQKEERGVFFETVQENIVPFGACLIFTPDFVRQEKQVFLPETRFFYEEYILMNRCLKKGYRTVYDPTIKVCHKSGAATKSTFRNERKRMRFMLERTKEAAEIYMKEIGK